MKKFKENVKGIILMVLVVTIIILLILSSVAIKLSLDDKGVIKEAKEAVNKWDRGSVDEENQLSKLASDMRKLRNKTTGSGGSGDSGEDNEGPGEGVDKPLSGITGNERENTKTKDKYGNNIVVPAGFKIVNPEDDVTKGIVIEDESANDEYSKGNQYVWIPVTHVDGEKINTIKDNRGYEHTIELARYTFDVGDYDSSTQSYNGTGAIESKILDGRNLEGVIEQTKAEQETNNRGNAIARDIIEFKESVKTNGGYYLARYEAGDPTTEVDRIRNSSSQTIVPVFKDNQIVYSCITEKNASILMENLYYNQSNNYVSDLVNSYAWDTAIVYIQEFSEINTSYYSKQNALQNSVARTGQATNGINKDIKCNIYDMAGNVYEWTTEAAASGSSPCISRGGSYNSTAGIPAKRSYIYASACLVDFGFRRNFIYKNKIICVVAEYNIF